jgi:hypothetical protein
LLHADDLRVNRATGRERPAARPDRRSKAGALHLFVFKINRITEKKQGAAGITTAAPYIAGQWGRGDNRLSK